MIEKYKFSYKKCENIFYFTTKKMGKYVIDGKSFYTI